MLSYLHIKNFAIIDQLELTIAQGMTVLTGETGAGKSILLDALSLVLGDRAASDAVRHGCDKAEVIAGFDITNLDTVTSWLNAHDLDTEGECILRRIVNRDGPSKAYINGRPVPLSHLRELGEQLVDIHGQHEHQSLLKAGVQRGLLDDYGNLQQQVKQTQKDFAAWQDVNAELERLKSANTGAEHVEFLRYQVQELQTLDLNKDELESLGEEHKRLTNGEQIMTTLEYLQQLLGDDDASLHNQLARAKQQLSGITRFDNRLSAIAELLDNALIQIDEAASTSRQCLQDMELDPRRLAEIDARLSAIHELARKHHVPAENLPELAITLAQELETLEHVEQRMISLQQQLSTSFERYKSSAEQLSAARQTAAEGLNNGVTDAMQGLNLSGGSFRATVGYQADAEPTAHGNDLVQFDVSANPGQPLKSLRKVASGGELSRISLAIQLMVSNQARIPTLIFDEVDAGIGGATAEIVGKQLARLGQYGQVLCVTHLAQVAAQAHNHIQISKLAGDSNTRTTARPLDQKERIAEVARMLGGMEVTEQSLAHAREMVEAAVSG